MPAPRVLFLSPLRDLAQVKRKICKSKLTGKEHVNLVSISLTGYKSIEKEMKTGRDKFHLNILVALLGNAQWWRKMTGGRG